LGDNSIVKASDGTFQDDVLSSERPVLVDFWADWCTPCHMVAPVVEEISRENEQALRVAKLNVDENPETARRFGVMSIPTLILFKNGEEKARVVGARGKEAILAEIEPHISA
jgi:thioredoxin 1